MILIVLVITISLFSVIGKDKATETIIVVEEQEETDEKIPYGDNIQLPYNPRELSNYKVVNLDSVLSFIDPHEMQNYDDLLTLYSSYIPLCINILPEQYYENNRFNIREMLGIYTLDEYLDFYNFITKNGVTKESIVDYIEVVSIERENSLLMCNIKIYFNNTTLELTHYLDYLYIEKESFLFLYATGGALGE